MQLYLHFWGLYSNLGHPDALSAVGTLTMKIRRSYGKII